MISGLHLQSNNPSYVCAATEDPLQRFHLGVVFFIFIAEMKIIFITPFYFNFFNPYLDYGDYVHLAV